MFAGTGMGRYAFRSLDINNGLSQNTVAAIIQDRFGFMWFGTKDGLNRYDGVSFQTFMKESGTLGNNFTKIASGRYGSVRMSESIFTLLLERKWNASLYRAI